MVEEIEIDPELLRTEEEEQPQEEAKVEELDGKAQLRRHFIQHPDVEAKCSPSVTPRPNPRPKL